MRDLTQGSILRQLLALAIPISLGLFFQALYVLVDLYFVAQLGDSAIAGVAAAGNVQLLIMALTQILGVGTMALIAKAVGAKDPADANLIFNQSILLSALSAAGVVVFGYALIAPYMGSLGADAATVAAGKEYLYFFLPGLALQFALISMSSALRGTGVEKPTMLVQIVSVLLNAVLSPILITGWWIAPQLGVAGAGLASSISIAVGVLILAVFFYRLEKYVGFQRELCRPRPAAWRRILTIGLPPGGEFALLFVYLVVVYWVIRGFGAEAQAGFGIGARVMQSIFLPAMAIAFATAPVAGQNFGAGHADRVRETFRIAAILGSIIMAILTLICQWRPQALIAFFTDDAAVIGFGAEFLSIISFNFIASGLIFTCSGLFQALGNTVPSLIASASRLFSFALPAVLMTSWPAFELRHLWMLSVATVTLQALLSLFLLKREANRRLGPLTSS